MSEMIEKLTVTSKTLQKMFLLSERRIRQLAQEGILVRASKGKYELLTSVSNYIKYLKLANEISANETDGKIDYDEEHAKNERIKRKQNELKLKLMEGKLHSAEQIELIVTDMLINFKNIILALPEKLSPLLEERKKAYIKDMLSIEMIEVLNTLKSYKLEDFVDKDYLNYMFEDEDYIEDEEVNEE